jgi:hypothetical protein
MQTHGLANIESQCIQGGSLRDHGKIEALGHKLAFAFSRPVSGPRGRDPSRSTCQVQLLSQRGKVRVQAYPG